MQKNWADLRVWHIGNNEFRPFLVHILTQSTKYLYSVVTFRICFNLFLGTSDLDNLKVKPFWNLVLVTNDSFSYPYCVTSTLEGGCFSV